MKIEVYRIVKCGFYEPRKTIALFGHANEWAEDLAAWVAVRPNVASTTTYDPQDGQSTIYCAACVGESDGYGMVLWHSMPGTATGVAYIPMTATPGAVAASEERLPQNSIPGWPSYFWVLPRMELIVAFQPAGKIRNTGSGLPALRDYLRHYLNGFSRYAEIAPAGSQASLSQETRDILGWRTQSTHQARKDLAVRFDTAPLDIPCDLDVIRARCADICKLIHSFHVSRALPEERNRLEQALALTGWSNNYRAPEQDRLSFRWETDWQPTVEELDTLIAAASQRPTIPGRKERAGVRFSGDSKIYWLDSEPIRSEIPLPEALEGALTWSQDQLRQAWGLAREKVLALHAETDSDARN